MTRPLRLEFPGALYHVTVTSPEDWDWSSYRLMMSSGPAPAWLNDRWLLDKFHFDTETAKEAYRCSVLAGIGKTSPLTIPHHQLILGDEEFTERFQTQGAGLNLAGISRVQRRTVVLSLQAHQEKFPDRNEAIARAYSTLAYTIAQIANYFHVSHKTATRAIKLWSGRLPMS